MKVTRAIIYGSPRGRGGGKARKLLKQALDTIPGKRRVKLTKPDQRELMNRARSLAAARQGRLAVATADKLIKRLDGDKPGEVACEAYLARAKGLGVLRRYAEASDASTEAIKRCKGNPRQVVALFLGGRYALRGGRPALARKRYALLEKNFPKHRFADDARLHGAGAALALGDVAAFTKMLQRIDKAYPTGDMVDQGLFALARRQIDTCC